MSKLFMRPRLCHGWMDDKFHLILIVDLDDDQRGICLDIFPVGMCLHSFVNDQNEAFQFLQKIFFGVNGKSFDTCVHRRGSHQRPGVDPKLEKGFLQSPESCSIRKLFLFFLKILLLLLLLLVQDEQTIKLSPA